MLSEKKEGGEPDRGKNVQRPWGGRSLACLTSKKIAWQESDEQGRGRKGHHKEFRFDWLEGRPLEGVKLGNDMI